MSSTSDILSRLHGVVRSLEEMRREISDDLVKPVGATSISAQDRAQLSNLHRRISAALAELSAEERHM
ncbi:hypothetical protein [Tropicimonas sp. IMCC6043]|uniref:hypothetical protein n=1 Tax=Tropicimonas sp. IMCC6043 TaxID=2510645 RepID=UPI00101C935C|nr:hypothetical protein [Tropicimonas sp. IMCC6043]RYH10655.1 hypothetical protein EU800_07920 [Tropicimonas sp. IMCC6043]